MTRPRLAIVLAGLLAAGFLAWPGFSIDRDGEWRTVLAGFQLQKDTGAFIGASTAVVHFHGLDGRPGRVHFTAAPRVPGEAARIHLKEPGGVRLLTLGSEPVEVEVTFAEGSRDLELRFEAIASANPRPIRLSNLRVERDVTPGILALALLPFLLGWLVFTTLAREGRRNEAATFGVFVVAACAFFVITACDPVRALSFDTSLMGPLPLVLAMGFAGLGLVRAGSATAVIALVGIVLSLHLEAVHSGFVYDDRLWARPWTASELASTFVGSEDPRGISGEQYRPIASVSHALDHALWGPSPFAFHLVNMGLHSVSAFLLFVLLKRLGLPQGPSFLGALTLAVHPLAASSIGWISERTDTLADIFILSSLIVFLGPMGTRTLRVLGVALLGLWSKETAVMLPALAVLFAAVGLNAEERKARFATLRALIGFVVLYVVVWISLFPEKSVNRLQTTPTELPSGHNAWMALLGNVFSQLFHPIGFEAWRSTHETGSVERWVVLALVLGLSCLGASLFDRSRALPWRVAALGLAFSALVVLPLRGNHGVDVYRLGHSTSVGFGVLIGGLATLLARESRWRSLGLAALLLVRFGPVSQETSAAWGYPGFQFRMALRFNRENPVFVGGLDPEMRADLARETRFEAHRDKPVDIPFEP